MICGWQIFMRLKTQPVLAPYRGEVKPPVQLVVLICWKLWETHTAGAEKLDGAELYAGEKEAGFILVSDLDELHKTICQSMGK